MPAVTAKPKAAKPSPTANAGKPKKSAERPVMFPSLEVRVYDAFTAADMMVLLGWEPEPDDVKYGDKFLLTDLRGKKVRCTRNVSNRPFDEGLCKAWMTEILKKHWKQNGETFIVGKYGSVLSGQHRGTGLILAKQACEDKPHWKDIWGDQEPTMPLIVVYGVEETDDVINTVDTGKPRSTADALYRSEWFAKDKPDKRRTLSRMTEYAVRLLWARSGAKNDAFTPRRTHAETFDFLERHPRIVKAVRHIDEENAENAIGKYLSPGYAAASLYLMGCSRSDGNDYRIADTPSERKLDWSLWDRACEFWVLVGSGAEDLKPVRHAIGALADPSTGNGGTLDEKIGILAKAWTVFSDGIKPTDADVKLKYITDEDGIKRLAEFPDLGGIDLGKPDAEVVVKANGVNAEQVEKDKVAVRKKKGDDEFEKLQAGRNGSSTLADQLEDLEQAHPGYLLVFRIGAEGKVWRLYGGQAVEASKIMRTPLKKADADLQCTDVRAADLETGLDKLVEAGFPNIAYCSIDGGKVQVRYRGEEETAEGETVDNAAEPEEVVEEEAPKPAPKAKPKPKTKIATKK